MNSKRSNTPAKAEFGLHVLAQGINPVVDIIAVHGLDGHLERSWTADNGTLWLRDLVPELIPHARMLTYGYDGYTRGKDMLANESIHNLGKHLLTCIAAERQDSGIERRPIIFVAHSLGGIVVKSALITANAANSKHNRHHKAIEVSTHGIIFLGTPHQGSERIDLALILLHIQSIYSKINDAVLGDLNLHSKALQQQLDQYTPIGDRYETKFYYEVYPTKLFAGKSMKLVDQHSAVVPGMQNAESIALNKDHVGIAKFGDQNDADFKVLVSHLSKMAENAAMTIAEKWRRYMQHEEIDLQYRAEGGMHMKEASLAYKAVPLSSNRFIGRLKYRERMSEYFGSQDDRPRRNRMFLLHGAGGMGKSEISLKYAEDQADRYEVVCWLDSTSAETMKVSLQNISQMPRARAANVEDSPQSVLQWIAELPVDWLMIFDNADNDPHIVTDNIPGGARGNIIITSRNRTLRQAVPRDASMEVEDMDEEDAISLLLQSALLDDTSNDLRQSAAPIVKQLCCLPLAVALAGAAISSGQCNLADYLQTYSDHRQSLMRNVAFTGASRPSRAVYGTWDVSSAALEDLASQENGFMKSEAARSAIGILQIFGFLHHENILEEIFKRAAESPSSVIIPHAAESSEELSRSRRFFKQFRRSLRKTKKHLNVGEVPAKEQPAEDILEVLLQFLRLNDDGHWDPIYFRRGIELLLSFSLIRVDVTGRIYSMHPLVHAWCRDRLSITQQQSACLAAMKVLAKSIVYEYSGNDYAFRRALIPHISTEYSTEVRCQYNEEQYGKFSLVLYENGYWEQSETLRVQIMKERLKILGAEHPNTLRSMINVASTYWIQGRWKEAEQLEIQVMQSRTRVLGKDHSDTLLSMSSLAVTYWSQGRWKEAEELQVPVMETRMRVLGLEHHDTLFSMGILAATYWSQGRLKEAEELEVQVMETRTRILGVEHPDTLDIMVSLAATHSRLGRWKEAEELEVRVMEISTRVRGAEHPDTLDCMYNLALTFESQGRSEEAITLMQKVVQLRIKRIGSEHPDTIESIQALEGWRNGSDSYRAG